MMQKKDKIGVGIMGFGTIGTGVVRILTANAHEIQRRLGVSLSVGKIADLDIHRDRGVSVSPGLLTTQAEEVIGHPAVDIVVELIGGCQTPKDPILKDLASRKHVVTA